MVESVDERIRFGVVAQQPLVNTQTAHEPAQRAIIAIIAAVILVLTVPHPVIMLFIILIIVMIMALTRQLVPVVCFGGSNMEIPI